MYSGNIEIDNFNQYTKPKSLEEKQEKVVTYENKNGQAKERKAKNS